MLKDHHILITGGAGFIANKIIAQYVDHNKITIFDNFSRDTFSSSEFSNHSNISVIKGDVRNYDQVFSATEGHDIIVHAAGIAGIDTVIRRPVDTMEVNMLGTANVLRAAAQLTNLKRLIDFSTSEVFGPMSFRSNEEDSTVAGSAGEARWTYAVSKLAGEHLTHAYCNQINLPAVTVRPFNVYGPGQTGEGALINFIKRALLNEPITINGDGSQIRAWCYVDDFVDAIKRCLETEKAIGRSYNIGNSRAVITVYGLAQLICRVLGSQSEINFMPALSADIAIRIPDVERSRLELGFEASVDLEEGVLRTANWLRQR